MTKEPKRSSGLVKLWPHSGPYLSSAPKIGLLLRIRTFPRKRSETAPKIGHILYFFAKVKSAATPSADIEFGLIEVDNARVNTIKQR